MPGGKAYDSIWKTFAAQHMLFGLPETSWLKTIAIL